MEMNIYQQLAEETAVYKKTVEPVGWLTYVVLGLCGEAGELANKVKKVLRDKGNKVDEATKQDLIKELGDCQWYIAMAAQELGTDLDTVARTNITKLQERKAAQTLQGEGDKR